MKRALISAIAAVAAVAGSGFCQAPKVISQIVRFQYAHFFIASEYLILSLCCNSAIAQQRQSAVIDSCFNFKNKIFTSLQIDSAISVSYAGSKSVSDYYSVNDKMDGSDINCVAATGCDYSNTSLVYDVYYPSPLVYTQYKSKPLPAVILLHGGGFSDCYNKTANGMNNYCKLFAQRGYVAFNVEYRSGRVKDGKNLSPEQVLAVYRAIQDLRGAIRSVIKRQTNNLTVYKLDTAKLFIGGCSAGGITSLYVAFCNQSEVDNALPGVSNTAILGPIDKDDYYGSVNIRFSIKGVLNMWGGLMARGDNDATVVPSITSTDKIPVIAFHGEKDSVVAYASTITIFSSGSRAAVTECGFTYRLASQINYNNGYGSLLIYNRLKALSIPTELYLDSDEGHGLDSNANFGLSISNFDTLQNYIVERAATFFQAVLNNTASKIQKSLFIDCKNNRVGCSMSDNYCTNSVVQFNMGKADVSKSASENNFLKVQVFPNPTATDFTLTIQSNSNESIEIIVTNMYGKKVYEQKGSANNKYVFGGTFFRGLYFIQVRQGKNVETLKAIKK